MVFAGIRVKPRHRKVGKQPGSIWAHVQNMILVDTIRNLAMPQCASPQFRFAPIPLDKENIPRFKPQVGEFFVG
jgi:hypothetical protein